MKKVYLIRHALPDFPQGKRMCLGRTDIPLGPEGLAQAWALAEKLPAVATVFSSPLSRAIQTARAIAEPILLEDLQELYAGQWDGLTFDEIRLRYPELYAAREFNKSLPLPGAESSETGLARFCRAMEEAGRQAPGDFAVVAHGGIIAQFLQSITGTWYKPGYAEVVPLIYENGRFSENPNP